MAGETAKMDDCMANKGKKDSGDPPAQREDSPGSPMSEKIKAEGSDATSSAAPDFDRLSQNLAVLVGQGGKALAALLEPSGEAPSGLADRVLDAVKTFGRVAEYWL